MRKLRIPVREVYILGALEDQQLGTWEIVEYDRAGKKQKMKSNNSDKS